jgi:hypothetical protein
MGADSCTELMQAAGEVHRDLARHQPLSPVSREALTAAQKRMWLMTTRIGVRRGSRSPEYERFWDCMSPLAAC